MLGEWERLGYVQCIPRRALREFQGIRGRWTAISFQLLRFSTQPIKADAVRFGDCLNRYEDVGGLDAQKQEIREAVELPLTQVSWLVSSKRPAEETSGRKDLDLN